MVKTAITRVRLEEIQSQIDSLRHDLSWIKTELETLLHKDKNLNPSLLDLVKDIKD